MRSTPSPNSHAHEHEWRPIPDLFPVFEDGAAIFHQRCEYVEQSSAGHSKRLDETFYRTEYECDETRSFRYDLVEIIDRNSGQFFEKGDIWADGVDAYIEEMIIEVMEADKKEMQYDREFVEKYFLPEYRNRFLVDYNNKTYKFEK